MVCSSEGGGAAAGVGLADTSGCTLQALPTL
jgi:hypothetical protein